MAKIVQPKWQGIVKVKVTKEHSEDDKPQIFIHSQDMSINTIRELTPAIKKWMQDKEEVFANAILNGDGDIKLLTVIEEDQDW